MFIEYLPNHFLNLDLVFNVDINLNETNELKNITYHLTPNASVCYSATSLPVGINMVDDLRILLRNS